MNYNERVKDMELKETSSENAMVITPGAYKTRDSELGCCPGPTIRN